MVRLLGVGCGGDVGDHRKEEFCLWHADSGAEDRGGGVWIWSSGARSSLET